MRSPDEPSMISQLPACHQTFVTHVNILVSHRFAYLTQINQLAVRLEIGDTANCEVGMRCSRYELLREVRWEHRDDRG